MTDRTQMAPAARRAEQAAALAALRHAAHQLARTCYLRAPEARVRELALAIEAAALRAAAEGTTGEGTNGDPGAIE